MTELTLRIEGMTCAHCVARVEAALRQVPGVAQVRADLAAAGALVRYDDSRSGPQALIEAVRKVGYQASVQAEPAAVPGQG